MRFVREAPLLAAAAAVCLVACGSLLTSSGDDSLPPGSTIDAAGTDVATPDVTASEGGVVIVDDGAANVPPPREMPGACPVLQCDALSADDDCHDEDCDDDISRPRTGSFKTANSECIAEGDDATVSQTMNPSTDLAPRTMGVAFQVRSFRTDPQPRPIARIAINGSEAGDRYEAVLENGRVSLCEKAPNEPTRCTTSIALTNDAVVHVYGLMAVGTPRGSFALRVGCDRPKVIARTRRLPEAAVIFRVGCLDTLGTSCTLRLDSLTFASYPE